MANVYTKGSISERTLLVHLTINKWAGKKSNKDQSRKVALKNNASADACTLVINLIGGDHLKPINRAADEAYRVFKTESLPMYDGGWRVIPSDIFLEFQGRVKACIDVYNQRVEEFLEKYPSLIEKAGGVERLGEFAKDTVLPSVSDIRNRFAITVQVMPMANTTDFRVRMMDDDLDEVRKEVEATVKASMQESVKELYKRFADLVTKVQTTMEEPDKQFKVVIIDKLRDFVRRLPLMNIAGDPVLDELCKDAEKTLVNIDGEQMRTDPKARKQVAKDAKAIVKKLDAFFPVR